MTYDYFIFSGQGFVLPGNNKLGYLFYKDRYYSISTVDRAEQFGRNPDLFIVAIKKLIKDSPCLLKLLNVTDEEAEEEESPSKIISFTCATKRLILENLIDNTVNYYSQEQPIEAVKLRSTKSAESLTQIIHGMNGT